MRQIEGNNYTRKGKYLRWEERISQREGFSATVTGNSLQPSIITQNSK